MPIRIIIISLLMPTSLFAQSYQEEMENYRQMQHEKFSDSLKSPLDSIGLATFDSLDYFPVNSRYRVKATLELTPDSTVFEMPTSTNRKALYRQFGWLHFSIQDSSYKLALYKNLRLAKLPAYQDYYFLPFTDATNGFETYGGGRYLDIRYKGESPQLVLDFNKAYNPYCAYNSKYSCPIPPKVNHLPLKIEAGVKNYKGEYY